MDSKLDKDVDNIISDAEKYIAKEEQKVKLSDMPNVKSTTENAKSGTSLMSNDTTEVLSSGGDSMEDFTAEETLLLKREIELLQDKVKFYRDRCKYLEKELVKKDIDLEAATKAYHKVKAEYTFILDSIPNNRR